MNLVSHCKQFGLVMGITLLVLLSGCAEIGALLNPPSQDEILGASFARMEQRLLDSYEYELNYVISAEGAFSAALEGGIKLRDDNIAEIWGTGTFGTNFVDYSFTSNGDTIFASYGSGSYDAQTPAELNKAIIIGLTRMGLLHNIVRVISGELPDHGTGEVDSWVQVSNFGTGAQQRIGSSNHLARPIHFNLTVSGEPSGRATVWEEPTLGIPLGRDQVVNFAEGEMRVTERYSQIIVRDEPREITIEGE